MNNTGSRYSNIYDFVMNLLCDKKITPDDVAENVSKANIIFSAFYPDETINEEELTRKIIYDIGVFEGSAKILEDNGDHKEWLAEERASINWNFWNRYKKYLEKIEKLPPSVVKSIDDTSEDVLKRLESPRRKGSWDRRGMVVGNVQSGKTSNYIGLISKAVDAGYKIIIVLAGLNNDLRSQTQKRIDKGFIGRDTQKKDSYDQTSSRIGAGLLPGFEEKPVIALTSSLASGDFKKKVHESVTITPGGDPIIAVVKKNVTPLRNLLNWFTGRNESGKITNIPLLLIDDEADNASIDTKAIKKIGGYAQDNDLEEQDPTKINGLIRQILNCFSQSAYVGYTATPFANIFIYPTDTTDANSAYGEDLYPRSFIVSLEPPSNYIGPSKVFGLYRDKTANINEVKPLPLIRKADDYQEYFPEKHKSWLSVTALPDSIYRAIYSFILAGAAKDVRGQGNKHHSMLIHVTRFVDVQFQITELVKDAVKAIVEQLEFRTGPQYEKLIADLEELWEKDFVPTTKTVREQMPEDTAISLVEWNDIEERLYPCASKIEVKAVNGKAADGGLEYDLYPNGCSVIAIGGDKLSRGLTLEGLTVSYYSRLSKAYDTLLQMGRWFGYRGGYADLCRLYTSTQLTEWYKHIAVANEELRRELSDMADLGATPENYGLKVRTHPDGMLITAMNKMRNSEVRMVTYAGKLVQITRFYKNNPCNAKNLSYLETYIKGLGTPVLPSRDTKNNYLWQNVSPEKIVEFLQNITIHGSCSSASPKIVSQYITNQVDDGELTNWTVALISTNTGEKKSIGGIEIGMSWRTDQNADDKENDTIYLISNNLITESDQEVDLTEAEKAMAMKLTIDFWKPNGRSNEIPKEASPVWVRRCRDKSKALLMIYVFRSGGNQHEKYDDIYVGYAISFPDSRTARPIEYKVDEVYLRNDFDED